MSAQEIDDYLAGVDEPKRSTLEAVRRTILELLPDAEQCISYGLPAFKVRGKAIAGIGAYAKHLSYFPHSGSVLAEVPDAAAYGGSKGTLQFPIDQPLPKQLVAQLIDVRMAQAFGDDR